MRHLIQFLASVPSIESLRLELEYAGIFENETPWDGNSTPLQLPRLTQLSVAIRTRTQPILLEVLAENLDLSKIKKLSAEMHFDHMDFPEEWFMHLLLSGMDPESLNLKFFDRTIPCQ